VPCLQSLVGVQFVVSSSFGDVCFAFFLSFHLPMVQRILDDNKTERQMMGTSVKANGDRYVHLRMAQKAVVTRESKEESETTKARVVYGIVQWWTCYPVDCLDRMATYP